MIFANKDLREKVEKSVTEKTAHSKSNHDGKRSRINVGRAEGEKEVWRTGDVEGREEGVYGG
jgi:hypothetical protein